MYNIFPFPRIGELQTRRFKVRWKDLIGTRRAMFSHRGWWYMGQEDGVEEGTIATFKKAFGQVYGQEKFRGIQAKGGEMELVLMGLP